MFINDETSPPPRRSPLPAASWKDPLAGLKRRRLSGVRVRRRLANLNLSSLPVPLSPADRLNLWHKDVYRRLKEVPDKALAASGYSEINLAKLFQAFSSLK